MKIALCLTTINVPNVLKLYRACDPDVRFFVAVDEKTPTRGLNDITTNAIFLYGENRKCSDLIGWNTLARRNIAFLAALEWGASLIVTIDDDNFVMDPGYFAQFEALFAYPWDGLCAVGDWFDPGLLLYPQVRQRGIPHNVDKRVRFEPRTDCRIGAAAGMVMGDTDQDATTRIANYQPVLNCNALGRAGVVVDHNTHTVFNTQVTCFLRELAPAMFLFPNVGRHDDIYASIVTRRVMKERGLYTHYGMPLVYQERNKHKLLTDLRQEIDGMENVQRFADLLDHVPLVGKSVIDDVRMIYEVLRLESKIIPEKSLDAGMSYLEDCEGVL